MGIDGNTNGVGKVGPAAATARELLRVPLLPEEQCRPAATVCVTGEHKRTRLLCCCGASCPRVKGEGARACRKLYVVAGGTTRALRPPSRPPARRHRMKRPLNV